MIQFKKLTPPDASVLAEVAAASFIETFLPVNNPQDVLDYAAEFLRPEVFKKQLEDPKVFTFGVFSEAQMVGYFQMLFNDEESYDGICFELKRFYLLAEYQGRGVAQQMMSQCVAVAREQGQSAFWLGVWEHNHRALRFYEKSGFQKIGSHPFVMGKETQTDLIYAKKRVP